MLLTSWPCRTVWISAGQEETESPTYKPPDVIHTIRKPPAHAVLTTTVINLRSKRIFNSVLSLCFAACFLSDSHSHSLQYLLGTSLALLARRTLLDSSWLWPGPPGGSDDLGDRIIVLFPGAVSSLCSSTPTSKVESGWIETGALEAWVSGVSGRGYVPSWRSSSCRPVGKRDGAAPSHPGTGFTGEMSSFLLIGILGTGLDACSSPEVGPERNQPVKWKAFNTNLKLKNKQTL